MGVSFNLFAIVPLLVTIVVGTIVIASDYRSQLHRTIGILLYFCSFWGLASSIPAPWLPEWLNLALIRLAFISAIGMSYYILRFIYVLMQRRLQYGSTWLGINLLFVMLAASPLVISGLTHNGIALQPTREPLYLAVVAFIVIQVIIALAQPVAYYRKMQPSNTKTQVLIVLLGLLFGAVAGVFSNAVLPNIDYTLQSSHLAWIPVAVWTIILVYAVAWHKFLDIRLAIVRSVGYSVALCVVIALYFGLVALAAYVASVMGRGSVSTPVTNIAIIVIVSALFAPLRTFFDRATARIFYRDRYDSAELYGTISSELAESVTVRQVASAVVANIGNALQPEQTVVYYRETSGDWNYQSMNHESMFTENNLDDLARYFTDKSVPYLEVDKYNRHPTKIERMIARRDCVFVFPLRSGGQVIGLLCLGAQRSRNYTITDAKVLATIASELSISIQKLLLVDEVQGFNRRLRREITRATSQLQQKNQQLEQMDKTKDEFVSMASHQLRTPLTSIKGYISMVLEGDVGDVTPDQRKLLEEAYTSSERMVHLIGDFLNVSRLQTGKFVIDRKLVDLAKIARQEVESIQQIASTHDIAVQYRPPARFPQLYLDEGKIRQVIMNFIDNAIYYSPDSHDIKVTLRVEAGEAVLRVIDKGMGVPAEVQEKLFTKFFRADNARTQRPDGTGIGLYLAKKVVDGHGGSLVFESHEGKGSTFGFRLPIKKLSTPPPHDTGL